MVVGLLQGRDVPTHCLHGGLLLWVEMSPLPPPCPFCWDSATMGHDLRGPQILPWRMQDTEALIPSLA